jgi:myo-inositol-1(or 4)-monophosphatase
MELQHELETAVKIAKETGQILLSHFSDADLSIRAKGERDVVTAADMESEALLQDRLHAAFPEDGVVGEEGTNTARGKRRVWYVDPLDGTLNFSRGVPVWSVSIALFDGDQLLLGVVHDPIRSETFSGASGAGAFLNGTPIQSSGLADLSLAFVHITVDFNQASQVAGLEDIVVVAPAVLRTRNIGSAALALAYVAAGRMDAMLHREANAWDYGAGALLVAEAGGSVSGMSGDPWLPEDPSIAAAASGSLRERLLATVKGSAGGPLE